MLDPDSPEGPEMHNTEVVINEQSPRFRAKFDFVYISATSMLTLTVFEKAGMWDSVMKFGKKVCCAPPAFLACLLHACPCGFCTQSFAHIAHVSVPGCKTTEALPVEAWQGVVCTPVVCAQS